MPPVEHAAGQNSQLERLNGMDAKSQLVRCLQSLTPPSRRGVITHGDGREEPAENVVPKEYSQKVMLTMSNM